MRLANQSQPPLTLGAWMRFEVLARHIDERSITGSVVEMGCGKGSLGVRLATIFDYTGVEPDPVSRSAAQDAIGADRINASLAEVQGRTFDAVLAFEVLEHIEADGTALSEWRDLLKPGGAIVLSVPAYQERFGPSDIAVGHFRRYSPTELTDALRSAGFGDIAVDHYGYPLTEMLEFARNRLAARRPSPSGPGEAAATAASGRFLQPPALLAPATRVLTAPLRVQQRRGKLLDRGAGLVASALAV